MASKLGEELRRIRTIKAISLRKIEEAIGVSNAYLSQLENGKAENPSPHILHKLATFLEIPYDSLMEAAGYYTKPLVTTRGAPKRVTAIQAALMSARLSDEEEKEVADFIGYLRSRPRSRSK